MTTNRFAIAALTLIFLAVQLTCQVISGQNPPTNVSDGSLSQVPTIDRYSPRSMLKVQRKQLTKAKYPVIDIHGHFGVRLKGDRGMLDQYLDSMDRNNIALSTSLDAVVGQTDRHFDFLDLHRSRFIVFAHIDFVGSGDWEQPKSCACNQPDFVRRVTRQLEADARNGVSGLKFFKQFGLGYKNPDGSLIRINDRRFDPIWEKCAELNLPVLIHTGDPAAFFEPIDANNERYEELLRHPNWSFHGDQFPSRQQLLADRNEVIARHPQTTFIGAHMAGNPEDLTEVGKWLDAYPNLVVEFSSRIGELGRQPFTARRFFIRYQDRILFGTDGPWPEERLRYYWRFLETENEYFPYSEKRPQPQGLWYIYGLNLPDTVLQKIYSQNAIRLLPAVASRFRQALDGVNSENIQSDSRN